ncbi:PLP-dependent aminotransferase family protein [Sphingomonas panacisoli]|nr:PLP-dependent aminotransferase family protein [Sphingomonas panacisoli]
MDPLFELKITTAPKGSRDVASHLFRQLKQAIINNRLPPGARLPSTRAAGRMFGVSRNTAQDVYDRLLQEGLTSARHGSGTYVRATPSDVTATPPSSYASATQPGNTFWDRADIKSWIGFWHERSDPAASPRVVADLRPALVDQHLFPHSIFRRVMARQLRRLETAPAPSRSPQRNQGNYHLRRAIAEHIGLTRAVPSQADDVLVTAGAQQAFDLIARTLVVPDETVVAVEDPGYPPMRVPFAAAGARIVPVRVDAEGIVVDEIPTDATIICVCPSHQFPLGMPLSPRRRQALLALARQTGAAIIEDDYDGEFRYGGSPLEALRNEASADHVFYVGSFSKCMLPAVRLGFLVAPQRALPALVAAKNASDWHCSSPIQMAVGEFIRDGHLTRHIRRVRRTYLDRRDHLVALVERKLGDSLKLVPSFYGMHMSAIVESGIDCDAVSDALATRGVMIHSLERYHLGPAERSGFVIGYAAVDLASLKAAIDAMAEELHR